MAVRCGPRLGAFDGVVAGEVYATTARIFELLASLFAQSLATSLTDAMAELARRGALGVVQVGDLDMHWFATRTLAAIFQHPSAEQQHASAHATPGHAESSRRRMDAPLTPPGRPSSLPAESWPLLHAAALELLYSGEWRPTANMPKPPVRGELERRTEPLLHLGSTLGEGSNGVVVRRSASSSAPASALLSPPLAGLSPPHPRPHPRSRPTARLPTVAWAHPRRASQSRCIVRAAERAATRAGGRRPRSSSRSCGRYACSPQPQPRCWGAR